MTLAVLVPVKEPGQAKSRLSPLLSSAEREQLTWLLLEGVLQVVAALGPVAGGPLRKVLVTGSADAARLGRQHGLEVLDEAAPVSESRSVDQASAALERDGVTGVLRVPLDLPLLRVEHLLAVLAAATDGPRAPRRAVLVPSRDGTGTNALFRSPPTLFPSRFGPGSLALHRREALTRLPPDQVRVLSIPALALDVDEPADLAALLSDGVPCPAADFLRSSGIAGRLERALAHSAGPE